MRDGLRSLLLVPLAVLAGVLLVEIGGRLVLDGVDPRFNRVMFFSQMPWVNGPGRTLVYPAATTLRSVAVYGQSIEYDVTFPTNNRGLVDDRDYPQPAPATGARPWRIALLGDSFTAGYHGGEPWIFGLRRRLGPDAPQLYNLGVDAAGIGQMTRLLAEIGREVHFDAVLLLAISDDFRRLDWAPEVFPDLLPASASLGRTETCLQTANCWIRSFDIATPAADLIGVAQQVYVLHRERPRAWLKGMVLYQKLYRPWMDVRERQGPLAHGPAASLARIAAAAPGARLTWVRLPQREEAAAGRYLIDEALVPPAEATLPALTACGFTLADFLPHDGHPNAAGYARLAQCLLDSGLLARRT